MLCCLALLAAIAAPARADLTYLPHHLAVETNQKYGHDCFWAPPKGMDYANLPNAEPIQKPNLYPDVGSTYFVAQYVLPEGASLTFHGKFGHQRYMSWTMFGRPGELGQIASADHLRDFQIKPDKGSVNPFLPGGSRTGGPRNYTFHVVSGDIPAKRAPNTIYTQTTDPSTRLGMSIRNYLPDRGRDGTGDAGLPKLVLDLKDGTKVRGKEACAMLDPIEDVSTSTFPPALWKGLVAAALDPVNAPAADPPRWETLLERQLQRRRDLHRRPRAPRVDLPADRQRRLPVQPRHALPADTGQPQVRPPGHGLGQDADFSEDAAGQRPLEPAELPGPLLVALQRLLACHRPRL